MDVNYESDDERQLTRDGHGRLLDDLGRVWQEAVWDDDLRAMSPSDVSTVSFPRAVHFRVDAPHAPCTTPFLPDPVVAGPPRTYRTVECHIHICGFLRAILSKSAPQQALWAICLYLPVKERRALSCLTASFRSATTRVWSHDLAANEQTLLRIVRQDQPEFLFRAITDYGACGACLGRVLLQATDSGRLYRRHRCCTLLASMGAVIRPEDAVKVTGGDVGYHDGIYVRRGTRAHVVRYAGQDGVLQLQAPEANGVELSHAFEDTVRQSAKAWKEHYWCHFEDGGYKLAQIAFSSSQVPPRDGWFGKQVPSVVPSIQTQPIEPGDLLYSGTTSSGQILSRSQVEKSLYVSYFNHRTLHLDRIPSLPPQWRPRTGRIPAPEVPL
ncbi:unnamed protein product [Symbiodinium sp. CCMP2592]|nr:unnamed protein product [Symbiodinium sp. CCMP2592]